MPVSCRAAMQRWAIIMAGGSGTRLWPLSQRDRPKQLLPLIEGRSLLRLSFERAQTLVPAERVVVIAAEAHRTAVLAQLPELRPDNFIGEPVGRDTAAAVALSAAIVAARDSEAVLGVFTADHVIRPLDRFARIVERAFQVIEQDPGALVTFGLPPSHPHTGFGYIHRGLALGPGIYEVRQFKEKPDLATASRYVADGEHFWNSGMFVWRATTILEEFRRELPQAHAVVTAAAAAWGRPSTQENLAAAYPALPRISVDHAILERAARVRMVELDCEWHDVGSWTALPLILGKDKNGNTAVSVETVAINAHDNVLVGEPGHLVAAVGVEGLVVVQTRNATLVCRADSVERIREVVAELERRGEQPPT